MKALSLWDPWGTLIALGKKRIETRSWATAYRGPLAIHVAKRKPDRYVVSEEPFVSAIFKGDRNAALASLRGNCYLWPLGCIVAVCQLTSCVTTESLMAAGVAEPEKSFGDFSPGRFGWMLEKVQRLSTPLPWTGRQGLFEVEIPDSIELEEVPPS